MRILFITACYLPTTNGVTYHISSVTQSLRKLGHKVYILAPTFPGYKDSDKYVFRYPSIPNPFIKTYPLGIPLFLRGKLKKIKPDVIHTHHPLIIGQYAAQIADWLSKPFFFTAHTQYEQYLNYYFPHGYSLTSKIIIRDLQKLGKRCQKVVCPSANTELRLNRYGIENTTVINNGVEDYFFVKPKKKPISQPTLVFTGRLEKEKNPFFLLKIGQELKKLMPNFRLIIIGSGSLLNKLQQKFIQSKLENNLLFTGDVNRSLLPDIYKSAHVFLTPSTSEVMPLSLLEALASGLPAIALKHSGLEELILDGKTGFIVNKKPKEIAEKINDLFQNPKILHKLSLDSYKHAQKFSVEKTAEKLIKLYQAH